MASLVSSLYSPPLKYIHGPSGGFECWLRLSWGLAGSSIKISCFRMTSASLFIGWFTWNFLPRTQPFLRDVKYGHWSNMRKRPLNSYACPDQNQRNRANIFTGKKYSKLEQFYRKAHNTCERFHIFSPKGSFCSSVSLHPTAAVF